MANNIKFVLNGSDIWLIAEAPEDITLKQLLEQMDKVFTPYCACGICSIDRVPYHSGESVELSIDYDSIKKVDKNAWCEVREDWRDIVWRKFAEITEEE